MRKLSQSESAWEVSTAVSSRESGYHSGIWPVNAHSQDQVHSEEEEEAGETKLDLLDSLILEDFKERLQQAESETSLANLQWGGKEHEQSSLVDMDMFIQNKVPLVFPGQVQSVQSVSEGFI